MDAHQAHLTTAPLASEDLTALQVVADPTRARIVALLRHGEHCVCDVGALLELSTGLVSHHLRVLRSSGLLRERRSGRWVYYSLDLERIGALRAAISDLLEPGAIATGTCECSDCGTRRAVGPSPSPLRRQPALSEVTA